MAHGCQWLLLLRRDPCRLAATATLVRLHPPVELERSRLGLRYVASTKVSRRNDPPTMIAPKRTFRFQPLAIGSRGLSRFAGIDPVEWDGLGDHAAIWVIVLPRDSEPTYPTAEDLWTTNRGAAQRFTGDGKAATEVPIDVGIPRWRLW